MPWLALTLYTFVDQDRKSEAKYRQRQFKAPATGPRLCRGDPNPPIAPDRHGSIQVVRANSASNLDNGRMAISSQRSGPGLHLGSRQNLARTRPIDSEIAWESGAKTILPPRPKEPL